MITGGSGFIGSNAVRHYVEQGWEVCDVSDLEPRNKANLAYWKQCNLLDKDRLGRIFSEFAPQLLLHLAARTDLHGKRIEDYAANTDGVANVLEVANSTASLERATYASSRLVFRIDHKPAHEYDYLATTLYGQSKVAGELLVRNQSASAVPWIIIRPTSIWGPWFDVPYKDFFVSIARGRYVHPAGRQIHKTFGFVGNAVHAIAALQAAPLPLVQSQVFFIADYDPIEVREFAEMVRAEMKAPPIKNVPLAVLRVIARCGDALQLLGWRNVPITSFRLDNLLTNMVYDMKKLQDVVGPLPYTTAAGVRSTVDWMRDAGHVA